ncbi:hypothetical protein UY3_11812 [Chelonia mydas]|uniref:Uncharacterized protein n=1 Tax=Chelonia mydas TaxID=8469 RepID=M7BSE9_CHEMY|nr:hypothetical protein UY3_11812 [Chelonia mydas]
MRARFSRAWQLHHNAIQDRLVKAIPTTLGEITVNRAISGTDSQLRPGIVVTSEEQRRVVMVAIRVPFENRTPTFHGV